MPERTTIEGLRLMCRSCQTVFIIGANGIDATRKRVMDHMKECFGILDIRPVDTPFSRPKGLTYVGDNGAPVVVYDGGDWDVFWNKVMTESRTHITVMSPKWELTKD
jgi:hypothetical protein